MSLELILSAMTNLGARWVLWLLVALSIIGLAIVVERAVCFWHTRDDVTALAERIAEKLRAGEWTGAENIAMESRSFEARVAGAALRYRDPETADEAMLGETARVRLDMERYLGFLGTVGSNAPFVGLLGTVIGIIGAFRELGRSQGALTAGLMHEIGEALVATAVGLLVALPAVTAFNVFRRLIQTRLANVEALRRSVLAGLKARAKEPV